MKKQQLRKLTTMAMLVAISIVLVACFRIKIIPSASYLEYDMADIPILVGAFLFGPGAGLALTAVVSVIQGLTVSVESGVIGILMHFFATGSFVFVAATIYHRHHTRRSAICALIFGGSTMVMTMMAWNLIFTPIFTGVPVEGVMKMLLPIILPFNLIKAAINGLITYLVYKPIGRIVKIQLPDLA